MWLNFFSFLGQVTIEFHVEKETNFIVLHIQELNVTEKAIVGPKGFALKIVKVLEYPPRQQLYIELKDKLRKKTNFTLNLRWYSRLEAEPEGFYVDQYETMSGVKRYANCKAYSLILTYCLYGFLFCSIQIFGSNCISSRFCSTCVSLLWWTPSACTISHFRVQRSLSHWAFQFNSTCHRRRWILHGNWPGKYYRKRHTSSYIFSVYMYSTFRVYAYLSATFNFDTWLLTHTLAPFFSSYLQYT